LRKLERKFENLKRVVHCRTEVTKRRIIIYEKIVQG